MAFLRLISLIKRFTRALLFLPFPSPSLLSHIHTSNPPDLVEVPFPNKDASKTCGYPCPAYLSRISVVDCESAPHARRLSSWAHRFAHGFDQLRDTSANTPLARAPLKRRWLKGATPAAICPAAPPLAAEPPGSRSVRVVVRCLTLFILP